MTIDSINAADPTAPTEKPVPYTGVQFVAIPEFQGLGTAVGQIFADALGIAYQIRDDILDFTAEGDGGSDAAKAKATYPALFGIERATDRADALLLRALAQIEDLGEAADGLRWMARYTMLRSE